jgi:hypothetical protein
MRDIQPGGPPTCPVCQGQPQAAPCVICGGTGQAPAPLQVCDCGHGRWNHDLLERRLYDDAGRPTPLSKEVDHA